MYMTITLTTDELHAISRTNPNSTMSLIKQIVDHEYNAQIYINDEWLLVFDTEADYVNFILMHGGDIDVKQ